MYLKGTPIRAYELCKSVSKTNETLFVAINLQHFKIAGLKAIELLDINSFKPNERAHNRLPNKLKRRLVEIKKLYRTAKEFNPDIIYGQTHDSVSIAWLLGKLTGAKVVVDLHADESSLIDPKTAKGRRKLLKTISVELLLKKLDGVTVTSRFLADNAVNRNGVKKSKVMVLHGGFEASRFMSIRPRPHPKEIWVTHVGNLHPWQDIDMLLDVAEELKNRRDIRFKVAGKIGSEVDYKQGAEQRNLGNIDFLGSIKREDVPQLLVDSDILIIPRRINDITLSCYPSKLSEYIASGNPTVATRLGEQEQVIGKNERGLLTKPDKKSISKAILKLADDEGLRKKLGAAAKDYAFKHYTWGAIGDRLDSFFEEVLAPDT